MKSYFDELCTDQRLTCIESLFGLTIFYRTLNILINQINRRFLRFHELFLNFTLSTGLELLNEAKKLVNKKTYQKYL